MVRPHARGPMDNIRIQWNMGNQCNYKCEYCPDILHDGSKPWLPLEAYLTAIENQFYAPQEILPI